MGGRRSPQILASPAERSAIQGTPSLNVRHDGDRSGCFTDHVVVGVDDVHHAVVGTEVVEVEDPFGLDNGPAEATERILAARRRGDSGGV